MEVEIRPEPTHEERAAIIAALESLAEADAAGNGPWWKAGLRENVLEEEED